MLAPRRLAPPGAPRRARPASSATAPSRQALVEEWRLGAHGQKGVNCFDCHRAERGAPDAFEHNGFLIHVIVSPKDCARCHQKEVDEQKGSHHAKAGQILASLDNFLGEVVGGPPAVAVGCYPVPRLHHPGPAGRQVRPGDLAQHRHRPHQPGWQLGKLQRLPHAASLLQGAGARTPDVREVPPRAGPPADRGLPGVQAWHPLGGQQAQPEHRAGQVDRGRGLHGGADLRDLPHERHPDPGRDARRGRADQLDPAARHLHQAEHGRVRGSLERGSAGGHTAAQGRRSVQGQGRQGSQGQGDPHLASSGGTRCRMCAATATPAAR